MNYYKILLGAIILILIIILLNNNNKHIQNNIKDTENFDCINNNKNNILVKNVDKNICIPIRYLDGQPGGINAYHKYTPEDYAPIYEIGEIPLTNNAAIPHGYNSAGRITNNDYNRNVMC